MFKFKYASVFPLSALVIIIFGLSTRMFDAPAVGKFLDPFIGIVQNNKSDDLDPGHYTLHVKGIADSVSIFFDNRKVPHIYAKNDNDLYFAQGYVTARLRLWQMDFLTYVSAGRLSEIFDDKDILTYDRNQRRMGVLDGAKKSLQLIEKDIQTIKVLDAYTAGVNAYINELNYKQLPAEFKLFDYNPEKWTNLKSVLILKQLGNTLSGYEEDLMMSKLMLILGEQAFNKLYPDFNYHITPIVNVRKPDTAHFLTLLKKPGYLDYNFLNANAIIAKNTYNPKLGSNSWVVSGKKTKSGFPILANDVHLNFTLPCIWIEMQLSAPDINVYGVSIPGAPSIIIGFNKSIAWGITNGADDVKDWFKLKINSDQTAYEMDGTWKKLNVRVEEIKRRNHKMLYDTVYSSVHGPIVYNSKFQGTQPDLVNYAMRWELNNPSDEFAAFIKLNMAGNYKDYSEAIAYNHCPALNFSFACKDNTIAITHQGNMGVKFPGQGKFLGDGTKKTAMFSRYIPEDSLPRIVNPACHFLLSANQHPTFSNYPYYYNGYYSETRANEIQKLLAPNNFDIKMMELIQLNNVNSFATDALPVLLKKLSGARLNPLQKRMLASLGSWKGNYDAKDTKAYLFDMWWANIKSYTWDEFQNYGVNIRVPDDYVLLDHIQNEPDDPYFDVQETTKRENANDIVIHAFLKASLDYAKYNRYDYSKWSDFNKINIMHMTNINAFSMVNIPSSGHPQAINATSGNWGPSWRMVVELGDRPKAYGIYPGGQSGNIGSTDYNNFVNDFFKGTYYHLNFFINKDEAKQRTNLIWTLKK